MKFKKKIKKIQSINKNKLQTRFFFQNSKKKFRNLVNSRHLRNKKKE